jgi:hypothetical protein
VVLAWRCQWLARVARLVELTPATNDAPSTSSGWSWAGADRARRDGVRSGATASDRCSRQADGGLHITCLLFVFVVLADRADGRLSIFVPALHRRGNLIVLGMSSSESALPRIAKLEHLGCAKSVVGLVVPTGYSFNLDGTSIYSHDDGGDSSRRRATCT